MKIDKIDNYKRGWIIGNFDPTMFAADIEVGIHFYPSGTMHSAHYHKIANEINVCTDGECKFKILPSNKEFHLSKGDVFVVDLNEVVVFTATTDCALTVIKTKSIKDDKYEY